MENIRNTTIPYPKISYIRFFMLTLQSGSSTTSHMHDAFEFGYILRGSLVQIIGETQYYLKENDIFVINPKEVHSIYSTDYALILYLHLSSDYSSNILKNLKRTRFSLTAILGQKDKNYIFSLYCAAAKSYFSFKKDSVLICTACVNLFLQQILTHFSYTVNSDMNILCEKNLEMRMQRILTYIENHYFEQDILKKVSESESLAPEYVAKLFSKKLGKSFGKYVLDLRIEHAMKLLATTKQPIFEICYECGLNDSRSLNKYCHDNFNRSAKDCRTMNLVKKSEPILPSDSRKPGINTLSDPEALDILKIFYNKSSINIYI